MSEQKQDKKKELLKTMLRAEREWEEIRGQFLNEEIDDIPNRLDFVVDEVFASGYRKQGEGEWISVEDRLPEHEENCLIFTKIHFIHDHVDDTYYYDGIEISRYYKGFGFGSQNGIYAKFWMPLPEPPKGGEG